MVTKSEALEAFAMFDPEIYCMSNEEIEQEKQRTRKQNSAMWVLHEEVAREMEMQGMTMDVLLDALKVGVRPTKEGVHEVFKACMTAMYPEIKSTTELDRKKLDRLGKAWIEDVLRDRLGIYVVWPSDQPPMLEGRG